MARTKKGKTLFEWRIKRSLPPLFWGTSDTLDTCPERLLGVKSQGIILGHNESCSSQKPSLWDLSWPRCACEPQGGSWDKSTWEGTNEMIGLREDKDRENCHLIKDLNSTKNMLLSLSLSSPVCLSLCTFLFNKLFLFTFFLAWIHS